MALRRAVPAAVTTPPGLMAAGAMVDLATGGISLGGFTALGAAGAAIGAAGASGRKILRRLQGRQEVRLGDPAIQLLAIRAVATIRAFLARGHAAIEPTSIEHEVAAFLAAGEDGRERQELDRAWKPARGRAGWSRLSEPQVRFTPGAGRAEATATIAAALRPLLNVD